MLTFRAKYLETAADPSAQTSRYLAYLFSADRTEAELTLGRKAKEKLHDPETLMTEITGQYYAAELTELTSQPQPTELDRKRVKRIAEFMQQLSYELRQALSTTKAVPLFMLHAQVESYQHQMQKDATSRRVKAMFKEPKKPQKAEFLKLLAEDFAFFGNKVSTETDVPTEPVLWTIFRRITKTTQACSMAEVSAWLRNTILPGDGTAQALTWLPRVYIENVFAAHATSITLDEIDAEVYRGEEGLSEDGEERKSVDYAVDKKRKAIFAAGIALPLFSGVPFSPGFSLTKKLANTSKRAEIDNDNDNEQANNKIVEADEVIAQYASAQAWAALKLTALQNPDKCSTVVNESLFNLTCKK